MTDEPCTVTWDSPLTSAHTCTLVVHYSTPHLCICGERR